MRLLKSYRSVRSSLAIALALSMALGSAVSTASAVSAAPASSASSSSAGDSNSSSSLSISHPTAVAGVLSATVSYKAPKGASGLTYRVRYSSNKGKAWTTFATTTAALSLRVSPLTAGTSYTFEVSAKKTGNWGAWSDESNSVKPTGSSAPTTYSIAASASAGGTISPAGTTTVSSGGNQVYTFTPNSGFQILSVLVDGNSVGTAGTYTFSNVSANHSILANFVANSYGITATSGAHGTVTPTGTTNVYSGLGQSYTITPDVGYHVANVLVDGNSVGAVTSYDFTNVTAIHTISATFAINTYNIVASVDYGSGTISSSGTTSVNYGSSKTYTINPDAGYRINDIYVDGSLVSNSSSYTFSNVVADHTIMVSFVLSSYTINASVDFGSGTISSVGDTTVNSGGSKTYTITPNAGYVINELYVDGNLVTSVSSYTFSNVVADHTIMVSFSLGSYTISASVDFGSGTITPLGDSNVSGGGSKTYTITPDAGYVINELYVDGDLVTSVSSYTFSNVVADHTIMVSFMLGSYTITAGVDYGSGTISSSGDSTVSGGGSKTYTITPDAGYVINDIYVDGELVANASSYTFSNVVENHTIWVSFVLGFSITAGVNSGPGSINNSGVTSLASGSNKTYTFTPNANSFVSNVVIDGVSIGAFYTYTFTNVTADHTISVEFEANTYDLFADVDYGYGTVSPSGYHTVYNGDDQTYEFTPDEGYYVYDVTVDGTSVGGVNSYTFYNVKSAHEIWVSFELIRDYTINAGVDYGDGSISESGEIAVAVTSDKTFTFTPTSGNHIVDVVVDGVSKGAITTFTFTNVRRNHNIYVQFEADPVVGPTYTVTSSVYSGQGSISIDGSTEVGEGNDQSYSFAPADSGWRIKEVFVDGVSLGSLTSYTFTNVTEPHEIYVTFETKKVWVYSEISMGSGTIDPEYDYQVWRGDDVTYTITADDGWYVDSIWFDGDNMGGGSSFTIENVQGYHEIYVYFKEFTTFNINASVDYGSGTISSVGDTSVDAADSKTYDFTPATDYYIFDVLVDGESVGAISSYTFNWVTKNHTITVQFETDVVPPVGPTFTITYDANPDHSDTNSTSHTQTGEGDVSVDYNDYIAENGSHFWGWNTQANAQGTYYYPEDTYALYADVTLYAIWTYELTINVGTLDAGPFSSAWASIRFPDVADPTNDKTVTMTADGTYKITVLAGAMYPYMLLITGDWIGTQDAYSGPYTVTLTELASWDPRVYMPTTIADGSNSFTGIYVAISPAGTDGSISINFNAPN